MHCSPPSPESLSISVQCVEKRALVQNYKVFLWKWQGYKQGYMPTCAILRGRMGCLNGLKIGGGGYFEET